MDEPLKTTHAIFWRLTVSEDDVKKFRAEVKAERYTDIVIVLDGERVEMTYEEFKRRIKEQR